MDLARPKDGGGFEPCGRNDASSGKYPKCVPAARAARMSQAERKSAIQRKRKAESAKPREGKKPVNVRTTVEKKNALDDLMRLYKGDFPGHPFRGNQHTGGISQGDAGKLPGRKAKAKNLIADITPEEERLITGYTLNNMNGDWVREIADRKPHQSKKPIYRGMVIEEEDLDSFISEIKVGKAVDLGGSFTEDREVAEEFASEDSLTMTEDFENATYVLVTVKAGARGLHVEPYSVEEHKYQKEWIMPTGKMKIIGVKTRLGSPISIVVEQQ